MDRLTQPQRGIILLGFSGIVLIVLSIKAIVSIDWKIHTPLNLPDSPAILFFTLEESCECMQELVVSAETQVNNWSESARGGIPVISIPFEVRKDLANQYQVYRIPCLILLDRSGEVIYRLDFTVNLEEPFDLSIVEEQIRLMQGEADVD